MATTTTYGQVGVREDLSDAIYNIAPTETPYTSTVQKGKKASNRVIEWQTDTLATDDGSIAVIEGADSRSLARTIRTRGQVEPIMLNINDMDQIRQVLGSMLKGNDLLITQGAGNVGQLCLDLAKNNLFLAEK